VKSHQGTLKERPVVVVRKRAALRSPLSSPTRPGPQASSLGTKIAKPATAKLDPNKKEREQQARRELLGVLVDHWPRAFPRDSRQVRPLAIGIRQDLASHLPEHPPGRIGFVIRMYQGLMGRAYLRAVLQGGSRYDLAGNPRGEVTATEKEHAGRELHAFYEQRKKRAVSSAAAPGADPLTE